MSNKLLINERELRKHLDALCSPISDTCHLPLVTKYSIDKTRNMTVRNLQHRKELFKMEQETSMSLLLYTNVWLMPRHDLYELLLEHIEHRDHLDDIGDDKEETDIVQQHKKLFTTHELRMKSRMQADRAKYIKTHADKLNRLLLPQQPSMSFFREIFTCCQQLCTMTIFEQSLDCSTYHTVNNIFEDSETAIGELLYLSSRRINVREVAKTIKDNCLFMFFPPFFTCEYETTSLSPLLDTYVQTNESWNEKTDQEKKAWHIDIENALRMTEYVDYTRIEDIVRQMLQLKHNITPSSTNEIQALNIEDLRIVRYWMCVLFMVYMLNLSLKLSNLHDTLERLSVTRIDDISKCVTHTTSGTHLLNIDYGTVFCWRGFTYIRLQQLGLIRCKCILSLFVHIGRVLMQ